MGRLLSDISISLDGYVAGPDPTMDEPLGRGGEQVHEWALATEAWRESHGREGGERNVDDDMVKRAQAGVGAVLMGRRMFSGEGGPWGDEPFEGWWGDEPPFHKPVFVLTHHEREPLVKGDTTFTFVTAGIDSALEQARAAAGDQDVLIAGGADVIQQYLRAGHVDELRLHVAPALLGGGTPLFDGVDVRLEPREAVHSPAVTHVTYAVRRAP